MNTEILKHKINISKTVEIITSGSLTNETKQVWLVLHGYAQLPEYFIKSFSDIEKAFIIAPAGLSTSYISGFSGRVGANWMTSYERTDAIKDYINYLNQVLEHFKINNYEKLTINVVGFSQGAATASRFVTNTKYKVSRLILWAGLIPQELEDNDILNKKKVHFVYGTDDEFILSNMEHFQKKIVKYKLSGFTIHAYDDKHRIPKETFMELYKNYWT